jgi:membrane dipeptidase
MYIDTHLDTRWQSKKVGRKFKDLSDQGHIDLHKARQGGLFIGFFTGFPTESIYATEAMLRDWIQFTKEPRNNFYQIKNINDVKSHQDHWKNTKSEERNIGTVLHFEGAAGIDTELNRLHIYYEVGLRSMGITWNETNQFATGADGPKDRGLTKEGKDLIEAMQDLGIIIDVSHLNDKSFWDVIGLARSPVIASHSNLRVYADHRRNLSDEMVIAIKDTGGTIGINFCRGFLSTDENQHKANRGCVKSMISRVISETSINHVHVGSDFDGCQVPEDMGDITIMPTLLEEIKREENLSDEEITKIAKDNILRIMRSVWK